jgi:hypothetical protein
MSETERIKLLVVGEDGPVEIKDMPNDLLAFLILKLTERSEEMVKERTELKLTLNDLYGKINELKQEVEDRKLPRFVKLAMEHLIEHPIQSNTNEILQFDLKKQYIKVGMPTCNDQWTNTAIHYIQSFVAKHKAAYIRWPNNPEACTMYIDCHCM